MNLHLFLRAVTVVAFSELFIRSRRMTGSQLIIFCVDQQLVAPPKKYGSMGLHASYTMQRSMVHKILGVAIEFAPLNNLTHRIRPLGGVSWL